MINNGITIWTRTAGDALDPDAAAYIAAIETAGATVSAAQKAAISDFYVTEKAASRYTLMKRMYLPVWGVAAANAICMVSLTSGTFNGSVTHAAGYVQGDGLTGYFDLGVDPDTLGLTPSDGSIGNLIRDTNTSWQIGCFTSGSSRCMWGHFSSSNSWLVHYNSSSGAGVLNSSSARTPGIIIFSREGGSKSFFRRRNSGFDTVNTAVKSDSGTVPSINLFSLGINNSGSAGAFQSNQHGAYYAGMGYTSAQAEGFTGSLETMWETVTGLTLP